MTSASLPEQPVDGKKTTPPDILSDELHDAKRLLDLMHQNWQKKRNRDRPRYVFVIQSHGGSIDREFNVKVPTVTTVKDGETHTRYVLNKDNTRVNPPIVDSLAISMKMVQHEDRFTDLGEGDGGLLENVYQATMQLANDEVTKSAPVRYNIGDSMKDIKLFCGGTSLYDSIFKINIDKLSNIGVDFSAGDDVSTILANLTRTIRPAVSSFGLHTRDEYSRNLIGSRKLTPMDHALKVPFQTEHDSLQKKISDLREQLLEFKEHNKGKVLSVDNQRILRELDEKFRLYERGVHWYNNSRLSRKGISKESRIYYPNYPNTCISLSGLIQKGIREKIIDPLKDCIFVSTCRSHHDVHPSSRRPLTPPPPPPPHRTPSSSRQPSRPQSNDRQPSKRPRLEEGGTRKRIRKLNKKTRRVKMRRNKTKSRTRKY
jgi:hypothetical protein